MLDISKYTYTILYVDNSVAVLRIKNVYPSKYIPKKYDNYAI